MRINTEAVDGKVGQDGYTARATAYLQSFFDTKIEVLYTINGTAANIVALKALLGRFGSVICAEQAHINTYECGATEYNLGNKILTAPSEDAKLTLALIDGVLREHESHQYIRHHTADGIGNAVYRGGAPHAGGVCPRKEYVFIH